MKIKINDSFVLKSIGYDDDTETLEVEFLSGYIYQYYNVDIELYDMLMNAQSKGHFFNLNIKDDHPYSLIYKPE